MVSVGSDYSPRSVPESFQRQLREYSRRMGQNYRAAWKPHQGDGIWGIEVELENHSWMQVVAIYDWENATQDEPYPYRELDIRAIGDLVEADITQRHNTGDIDKDRELQKAYKDTLREKVREAKSAKSMDLLMDIAQNTPYHIKKLAYEMDYGQTSGFKEFHQVPQLPGE